MLFLFYLLSIQDKYRRKIFSIGNLYSNVNIDVYATLHVFSFIFMPIWTFCIQKYINTLSCRLCLRLWHCLWLWLCLWLRTEFTDILYRFEICLGEFMITAKAELRIIKLFLPNSIRYNESGWKLECEKWDDSITSSPNASTIE